MIKESDAAQFHHRQVISRRFVVTRGDAAIFFQPPKAPFTYRKLKNQTIPLSTPYAT
ncbi:hypothetical protein ECG581_4934 [Escherichia coli G58-1]|nr:hypothetical protein SFK218_2662 [Shigella flexneri K-218]EGW96968.1 hypothetical protein ECG581_4934 [Escherichia coli G58-1]EIQ02219.1 hypothetical protein SFK1770_5499 [Shigella flexneri K-1770]EIQ33220.1 hypothetical protein SFK404_0496 [Shigella flexneri K-404]EIQ55676.1 hypothetical protein SD22575_4914 [Shigella dysenteriae 225-75]